MAHGFDATELIHAAYRSTGAQIPDGPVHQWGQSVLGQEPRPGDVIVAGPSSLLYVGGGQVIAAAGPGEPIHYQSLSRFQGDITDVRRVL